MDSDKAAHQPPGRSHFAKALLFLAGAEVLLAAACVLFMLFQAGTDPMSQTIAYGMAAVFGLFLVFGALPAFALAWHGRFLYASAGLAVLAPLVLLLSWRSL